MLEQAFYLSKKKSDDVFENVDILKSKVGRSINRHPNP